MTETSRGSGRAELRGQILDVAAERFAAVGFRGTSLQDIADEVGCSKASLLYHFDSKDAILAALMGPATAALAELDGRLAGLAGEAARRTAVDGFVDLCLRFRPQIALLYAEIPQVLHQPAFADLQQMVDRLQAALACRSTEAHACVAALVVLAGVSAAASKLVELPDAQLRPMLTRIIDRTLDDQPLDARPPGAVDRVDN